MNAETGYIYRGEEEIRKARERGEPIRELTNEEISELKPLPHGHKDRSGSKPKLQRKKVRARNKAARKARKRNKVKA